MVQSRRVASVPISDEQMISTWPFSLPDDEQMSKKVGVVRTNHFSMHAVKIY